MRAPRPDDVAIGQRLRIAIGEMPVGEAAAVTGASANTFRRWMTGEVAADAKALAKIARACKVSLDWLLMGDVAGGASGPSAEGEEMFAVPMESAAASAGAGATATEGRQADWMFPLAWLKRSFGRIDGLRLIRVVGDSMEPDLSDGDWVMFDRHRTELRDGLHAVLLDDSLLVKRLQVEGRRVRLISRNPDYPPILLPAEEVDERLRVRGRVVWSSRVHAAS